MLPIQISGCPPQTGLGVSTTDRTWGVLHRGPLSTKAPPPVCLAGQSAGLPETTPLLIAEDCRCQASNQATHHRNF